MARKAKQEFTIGQRFGRLVVLVNFTEPQAAGRGTRRILRCRCDCGKVVRRQPYTLLKSGPVSCGCAAIEALKVRAKRPSWIAAARAALTTHGRSGSAEHVTWKAMHQRCSNPRLDEWHRYGGRGIKVCERWASFEAFLADIGPRPTLKHSIDRINNDGNYEPGNCHWATKAEQGLNKSTTTIVKVNGSTVSLSTASAMLGLRQRTVTGRFAEFGIWTLYGATPWSSAAERAARTDR